jgi:FixJ family two-component response regulator
LNAAEPVKPMDLSDSLRAGVAAWRRVASSSTRRASTRKRLACLREREPRLL